MSSKKKKKNNISKKKNKKHTKLIILISAVVLAAAVITFFAVKYAADNADYNALNGEWYSVSANNASGDEVDINEVYDVRYSNYQGRMYFYDGKTFQLWLHPGDINDGTHSGSYEIKENEISFVFDDGVETTGRIERSGGGIEALRLDYGEYEIFFTKNK